MPLKACSQSACLLCCTDDDCDGHRETREAAKEKDSILEGTNWINKLAAEKRALAVLPGVFHEPSFHYLDETAYLWSLNDFFANPKWRDDAIRRSKRNREWRQQTQIRTTNSSKKSKKRSKNINSITEVDKICSKDNCAVTKSAKESQKQRFTRIMDTLYNQSL